MKMNAGVWIGIIGGLIGFSVAIASVVVTAGQDAVWIVAIMLLFFGGMAYLFYRLLFKPMMNAKRLMKIGIDGKAKILEVKDTGVTINNNPQVKLIMEVKSSLGQTYTAQTRVLLSRLNPWAYSPGMEVPVKIDPENEKNVIINSSGAIKNTQPQGNMSVNTSALTAELEKLQAEQETIRVSGRTARAIIKEYQWLGLYVNGNNPYVEITVEVLPENAGSFSAKTRGVLAEASVPKYQPGKEIMVRYDYYDNSKVVIDHSL